MTVITKPMLAGSADLLQVQYPLAVTPKFDGIRVLILDGNAVSRTLKPIRNKGIATSLHGLPDGLDGEVISVSNNFQDSTTAVMSADSEIPWEYHIFDYVDSEGLDVPYAARMSRLQELFETTELPDNCKLVLPEYVYELDILREVAERHIADGYEGSIIRKPDGRYKCGRSTTKEGLLLKVKQFEDTEAKIIGFEEMMHNDNQAVVNALGQTERSQHKENKRESGMLGAFIVQSLTHESLQYKVGSGFTRAQRKEYWQRQAELIGSLVKVKYFAHGIKSETGCPRHPIFLGFRDVDDL